MRITLVTIGSRGDVQPYVALGAGLKAAGHEVKLATHSEFESFARGYGLDFAPIGGNPREMLESETGLKWLESNKNPFAFFHRLRKLAEPLVETVVRDTLRATEDADLILPATLGLFAVPSIHDLRGTPYIPAPLQPLHTTSYVGNPTFPPPPAWLPGERLYNRASFALARQVMWRVFGGLVNGVRQSYLKLPPATMVDWLPDLTLPVLYGYSRHVIPVPPDWPPTAHVTGYWFLDTPGGFQPPASLVDFLESGAPPVYIGFGSMQNRDAEATTTLVLDALKQSGQRGVILTGWGGLTNADLPDNVYRIESIPHSWLFPRMAAVAHHGGAGTTAVGLRAGVPSIVLPFFADQPFWADRVYRLGVGPKPIPRKHLTAAKLAAAIREAVTNRAMRERAAEVGANIRAENGVATAAEIISREYERLVAVR